MTEWPTWDELKKEGSSHYKTGGVEPIDLYRAGGMLHDGAIKDIIKYAYRCRREANRDAELIRKDMGKIIHYAKLIVAELDEKCR